MKFVVKICGLTNLDDALAAVSSGADALGFMFYPPSPRYLEPEAAAPICSRLPDHVLKVGVFVDASDEAIQRAVTTCGLDVVQLHGEETPAFCASIRQPRVMKAIRVKDQKSLDGIEQYRTDFWLLDTHVAGQAGGTGKVFNWDLARGVGVWGVPFLLAGGLTPENVDRAIEIARPAGVDVSSGVELSPGRKDRAKMEAFVRAARSAGQRAGIKSEWVTR